ncbi:hypothetical protein [Rhizobium sp. S9]|uniref:hypothetical protein n=1 Tax=Rhizobium sp. S9 TaxID=2035454 RepID=UPI00114198F7|nr:hypothetical protein [Rhizobium sp. S9]
MLAESLKQLEKAWDQNPWQSPSRNADSGSQAGQALFGSNFAHPTSQQLRRWRQCPMVIPRHTNSLLTSAKKGLCRIT